MRCLETLESATHTMREWILDLALTKSPISYPVAIVIGCTSAAMIGLQLVAYSIRRRLSK